MGKPDARTHSSTRHALCVLPAITLVEQIEGLGNAFCDPENNNALCGKCTHPVFAGVARASYLNIRHHFSFRPLYMGTEHRRNSGGFQTERGRMAGFGEPIDRHVFTPFRPVHASILLAPRVSVVFLLRLRRRRLLRLHLCSGVPHFRSHLRRRLLWLRRFLVHRPGSPLRG